MTDDDWVLLFRETLERGGDIVDIARLIGERAERDKRVWIALILRDEYGLTVRQVSDVLRWMEGGVGDAELRREVTLQTQGD